MKRKHQPINALIPFLLLIILYLVSMLYQPSVLFNASLFDNGRMAAHIETLSSEPYSGKLTGSEGNQKTMDYLSRQFREMNIKPACGESYFQQFSTVVPQIDTNPHFSVETENGKTREFVLYEDYNLFSNMNGGGADFSGEIAFAGDSRGKAAVQHAAGRIVVVGAEALTGELIADMIAGGARGIFCCVDADAEKPKALQAQKQPDTGGKTGASIAAGYLSKSAYEELQGLAGEDGLIGGVRLRAEIGFPVAATANVIGKVEGTVRNGETLLITADIDGAGAGAGGAHFPGAVHGASGAAMLIEAARTVSAQSGLPYQTIVFAGWNGARQAHAGAAYYRDHPLYPLESTSVIHLGELGVMSGNGLKIAAAGKPGVALAGVLSAVAEDQAVAFTKSAAAGTAANVFAQEEVPAVMLYDNITVPDDYGDTIAHIDSGTLRSGASVLAGAIGRVAYVKSNGDETAWEGESLLGQDGETDAGFLGGIDTVQDVRDNLNVILDALGRSLLLLVCALILAVLIGMLSGMRAGHRPGKQGLRALGSLTAFSIPDVLIVLVGWLICIAYAQHFPELKQDFPIRDFLVPLITLTILPTVYISRITFVTVAGEMQKDYVKNLKAKGLRRRRILYRELLPACMFRIFHSLPAILTMLLSSLIVMEYLFNYLGAGYYLIFFYNRGTYAQLAVLAAMLGFVYLLFAFGVRWAVKRLNPVKGGTQ